MGSHAIMNAEIQQRMEELRKAEEALRLEQNQVMASKRQLMVVQAHVMNTIDKQANEKGVSTIAEHSMGVDSDDEGGNDAEAADDDDVWETDWGAVKAPPKSPMSPK